MALLVTGGAGYVGSHVARLLVEHGEQVIVVDNLSTGFRLAVPGELYVVDIRNTADILQLMKDKKIEAVLHFAAKSRVPESITDPALYYDNNVGGTLSLLAAMHGAGVSKIVFSSTAAVYGDTNCSPISENAPTNPTSVYGRTKLMIEQIFRDYDVAYGFKSISLRYFNVAGAHHSGEIGEAHDPETHLIPNILKNLLKPEKPFILTGTDFPTRDGSCVRDYIQVEDLADAHELALRALRNGHSTESYNLGSGEGFSVREVIAAVERVTGRKVTVEEQGRRPGDPATLIASSEKFINELGWRRDRTKIENILSSAWKWHRLHPVGYGK